MDSKLLVAAVLLLSTALSVASTTATGTGTATPPVPPNITTFWDSRGSSAHFTFVSKAQFPTTPSNPSSAAMNVGFYFVYRNNTLYNFHREYFFGPRPSYCLADYARIVVVTSQDFGVTWSKKTVIIPPVPGAANECANDDGAAFYDEEEDMWHYLGQCMNSKRVWNMCHFTRPGWDPVGPFTPDANNPVVRSGQLWGPICANSGPNGCTAGMGEEGTPDIVQKASNGMFYVTFHGWNPGAGQSARGVAATKDWKTWYTSGNELPNAPIFTSHDCDGWSVPGGWKNNACVGGGEGSILSV